MSQAKKPITTFDPNYFTSGGGFSVAGVEGIFVSSLFKHTNWAKNDGTIPTYVADRGPNKGKEVPVEPSTVWEVEIKEDDVDEPRSFRMKASGFLMPSKDGITVAKDKVGPFLVDPKGKKDANLNQQVEAAFFLTSLANAGFDFSDFQTKGTETILGYRALLDEVQRKDDKGKPIGKNPAPVVAKLIHGPNAAATKTISKAAAATTAAPASGNGAAGPVAEFDAAATATETIMEILAEESPLPKAQVSKKVNDKLKTTGLSQPQRLAVLKATTDQALLEAGPWAYADGKLSL